MNQPPNRVVIAVFKPGNRRRVDNYCAAAMSAGWDVTVLLADGVCWAKQWTLPDGVEVVSLRDDERRIPDVWLYHAAVERLPGGLLRRAARLPGPLGKSFKFAGRVHRRGSGALRRRVFWPLYGVRRPRTVRRLAMRHVDRLDLGSATRLVIGDLTAVPFGWQIAQLHPDLEVTTAFDTNLLTSTALADTAV
jgi:hypothetical protein